MWFTGKINFFRVKEAVMEDNINEIALFRLSVLGSLASRERLEHGELKQTIKMLAAQRYNIPGSKRSHLTEKTIEHWYYAWKRGGIQALSSQKRCDMGQTKINDVHKAAILQCKTENKKRSISQVKRLLERSGVAALDELSRSSMHRFLKSVGLSRCMGDAKELIERRSFCAQYSGDLWYGDVMHGPSVPVGKRLQKVYLVSLMDDVSRLIVHSAFCLGETALDIEGVLKQALLKRGLPKKLVVDNGSAYRSGSLQQICARLEIRLVYCRPYTPEGKGKIEKWHRTVRENFLNELDTRHLRDLNDLNARLWAWVESEYHTRIHGSLEGLTPVERWQKDIRQVRPLGSFASKLEELFYHHHPRKVRKDGTVSFNGKYYEVPYELMGQKVMLVVDPHHNTAIRVESDAGVFLGLVTPLDKLANLHRGRARPHEQKNNTIQPPRTFNMVELALENYTNFLQLNTRNKGEKDE
jgi:putative transposase